MNLSDVEPLLSRDLTPAETPKAEAYVAAMWAVLSARYGVKLAGLTEEQQAAVMPALRLAVAAAIDRRRAKRNQMAEQESSGPFSVRWSAASSSGSWFLDAELADLDRLFGVGGTRSYRTPAPDAVFIGTEYDGFEGWVDV